MNKNQLFYSPLKYAGGKRRISPLFIKKCKPLIKKHHSTRLVEPFVGAANISLNVSHLFDEIWINDTNKDLASLYSYAKENVDRLISNVESLFTSDNNSQEAYLEHRAAFNSLERGSEGRIALLVYLNKHCFNGLYRENRSGAFNVGYGKYIKPQPPSKELAALSDMLNRKQAVITNLPWESVISKLTATDIAICDPPYTPVSQTANFAGYQKEGFTLEDHSLLVEKSLDAPCPVLITNNATPITKKLYKDACRRTYYLAGRSINCKGGKRQPAKEILAQYNKEVYHG